MTEQQVRTIVEGYAEIQTLARDTAISVAKIRKVIQNRRTEDCYINFGIHGETVHADFEESHCSCCSPEYHTVEFPLMYLWRDDFADIETASWNAHIEAERAAKAEAEAAEQKRRAEALEASNRRLYEQLKSMYEA